MSPMPGDSRDASDLRVDALSRSISYLLSFSGYYSAEALALLVKEDLRTMYRVWIRLSERHQQKLIIEARETAGLPMVVIGFLDEMQENTG